MFRRTCFALVLASAAVLAAATPSPAPASPAPAGAAATPQHWDRVSVAPTRTSIYIGSVRMAMPTFSREGQGYVAPYRATVFPYFFYNESGTLRVAVTDAQLATLASGQAIAFTGEALRTDGARRRVTGRATPVNPSSGRLDVHVFVSRHIELSFHTTYRFGP